jgi:hypothetical protein
VVAEPKWHAMGFETPKRMGKGPDKNQKNYRESINYIFGRRLDLLGKQGINST